MKCPRCSGDLEKAEVKSIRLDRCPGCAGTWFQRGELRVLEDKEDHGDYRWIDIDLWRDRDRFIAGEQEGLRCPKDGRTMPTLRYGDSGVRVDVCDRCNGIWVDKGEYDKIVDYLGQIVDTETVGDYVGDVKDEFVAVLTGRESLPEALRDIGKILYLLQLRFTVQHPNIAQLVRRATRGMPGT